MTVTLDELMDEAEHHAGADLDARVDTKALANGAGRYLYDMHAWRWRMGGPVALDLVENQSFVELPADFGMGEVIHAAMSDTVYYGADLVTLDYIEDLRAVTLFSPEYYYLALVWPGQETSESGWRNARLEVYPEPTSTDAGAISLVYRRGWSELNNGQDAANVPPSMEHLLRRLVRAFVDERVRGNPDAVEAIERSTELNRLKKADGRSQPTLGPMRGGILQSDARNDRRYGKNWTVTHPS